MTTYNTYQEAKIANPREDIYEFEGYFSSFKGIGSKKCNPADHCITLEKLLSDDLNLDVGDVLFGEDEVEVVSSVFDCNAYNNPDSVDSNIYILRAAALENIPTETPEEKEVLDGIGSAGEVELKNGDDVDAYGKPYKYVGLDPFNENLCICLANQDDDPQCFSIGILKKPETPQQRKDRERLEAVKEMFSYWSDDEIDFNSGDEDDRWVKDLLFSLYCAGYRKVEL